MKVLYSFTLYIFVSFSVDGAESTNDTETVDLTLVKRRNYEDQLEQTLADCKTITVFVKPQALYFDPQVNNLDKFEYDLDGLPPLESLRSSHGSRSACTSACRTAASDTCDECDCSHSLKKKFRHACKSACKDEF